MPEPSPTVSVVIPTYRHRDFVIRTLESVWAQTFSDYEIVLVNDGSPDDTDDVLKPFVAAGRIHRYIRQDNAGQSAARNRGIAAASGEFIALLDDDDLWPPDKLERQVAALRSDPTVNVAYGSLECMDNADATIIACDDWGTPLPFPCIGVENPGPSGDIYGTLVEKNLITSPGQCLIRRTALDALDGTPLDAGIWGADDWDLWLRLAETGTFQYVPHLALRYRWHPGNASRDHVKLRANVLALYRKHIRRQKDSPQRKQALTTAYHWMLNQTSVHFLHLASMDYKEGREREAMRKLSLAARARTSVSLTPRYQWVFWGSACRIIFPQTAKKRGPEG